MKLSKIMKDALVTLGEASLKQDLINHRPFNIKENTVAGLVSRGLVVRIDVPHLGMIVGGVKLTPEGHTVVASLISTETAAQVIKETDLRDYRDALPFTDDELVNLSSGEAQVSDELYSSLAQQATVLLNDDLKKVVHMLKKRKGRGRKQKSERLTRSARKTARRKGEARKALHRSGAVAAQVRKARREMGLPAS